MTRLVSELAGAELAYWAGRSINLKGVTYYHDDPDETPGCEYVQHNEPGDDGWWTEFDPQEDWSVGGPLIDKHDITVERIVTTGNVTLHYCARKYPHQMTGPTYLIAAMRALVASVYGDELPDEVAP